MRVLVTGISGFLGPWVAASAREEWPAAEIVGLDLREATGVLAADLRDASAADAALAEAAPDVVIHLAGLLAGTLDELYEANVLGTRNLLEAVGRHAPGARVVVAGSAAEYGAVPPEALPVDEYRAPSPLSPYGLTKAWQSACALYQANRGGDVMVGRIFGMVGPGMPETLFVGSVCAQLARIAASGKAGEIAVGDLTARRDLIDVEDVACGLVALAARGRSGGAYNVCSGASIPMSDLLDLLVAASGADARIVRDPARVRASDVPDSVGRPDRIRVDTGWEPRVPLAESAARAVRGAGGSVR